MPRVEPPSSQILDLIRSDDWNAVGVALPELHPADIADVIERAPHEDRERLFNLLPDDIKPDVLAELESAAGSEVIESLTNLELSDIVEEMAPDDAADVLADLDEERSEKVLELMEEEESADVRKLMTYDEDTAGGIMTTDVVAMQRDQTVGEAIHAIADFEVEEGEPFFFAYIVEADNRLVGYVDIWELLRERDKTRRLGELVHTDFIAATANMDQEEVARLMTQYDLTALPVVDQTGHLVGRITADDVMDVISEEATEDILRLAGSDDAELEHASPLVSCAVRLPWLLITLLGGFLISSILKRYHLVISSEALILGAFVPIVLAMGGNTGIQSSTLVVRSIALGNLRNRNVLVLLLREIMIGAIMGVVCALVIGGWAGFLASQDASHVSVGTVNLAVAVGLALFSAMTFAAAFGALVPIVLNRFKIDPAVASGPFITITNDIAALLIYFAVTIALI